MPIRPIAPTRNQSRHPSTAVRYALIAQSFKNTLPSVSTIYLYKSIVYSFSLAAALLLPIKRLIAVKDLPTHRDSATLHSGVTD